MTTLFCGATPKVNKAPFLTPEASSIAHFLLIIGNNNPYLVSPC